jgi:tripartite-type tricarboxylate transporter receptor subunit TctC
MNKASTWFAAVLLSLASAAAPAQSYPARPVTIILPGAPGGGPDVIARVVADRLSQAWQQPIVILNRPGAGGLLGAQAAAAAKPDGYTLYMAIASSFTVLPHLQPNMPLDMRRDIVPVGLVGEQPFVIGVSAALGVSTLDELIALAKKRPGEITFGAPRGTMPHIAMTLFSSRTGIELMHVPLQGGRQAAVEVEAGRVAIIVESLSALTGAFDRGVKPLAVAATARLPDHPQLPTVAETVPGYQARGWVALMAPAGTAEDIVAKINQDLRVLLETSDIRQRFQALGTYARPMTPAETAEFIRAEQELWEPIVKRVALTLR